MKEAKTTQITELLCKQVALMRKGGAKQAEVAALLGTTPVTVSRIEAAGYDINKYEENRKDRVRREKEARKPKVELIYDPSIAEEYRREQTAKAEKEIEGQIEMDLTITKPEMSEQVKMMRFQAAQVDKVIMKLDQIYNMASMILRAVRKE